MSVPDDYHGREQTWLKHQVLRKYLTKWGFKLGSVGRRGKAHLWYVDCFAGPWRSQSENVDDTSVSIGLKVLGQVVDEWRGRGAELTAGAIFVEANPTSYRALEHHVERTRGAIEAHVLPGAFGDRVPEIRELLGDDAAFIFVDPTGWKGVGMAYIAQLADRPYRDVMINVMFQYINRFKDEERRAWLREQLSAFFGVEDNAALRGLDETRLLQLYRTRLKELSGLTYALDLAIPDPIQKRTFFHLVGAGRHHDVVELFREVEADVVGGEAAQVRDDARRRKTNERTLALFDMGEVSADDARYRRLHDEGLHAARALIQSSLEDGPRTFGSIWPEVLQVAHVTKRDLGSLVSEMKAEGQIQVEGMTPRERTIKDGHVLRESEP